MINEDEKAYSIRWECMSYFRSGWMPGAWVGGTTAVMTLKAFAKRAEAQHHKMRTEDAIPEDLGSQRPSKASQRMMAPPADKTEWGYNVAHPEGVDSGGNGSAAGAGAGTTSNHGRKSSRHPELTTALEEEEDYEEENNDHLYCYCQKVSYGDMVCCDNDDCAYQWFHFDCVGIESEPKGEWLCPTCRELPRSKIRISKDE
ncbi:hypothetical protein KC343_g699 [Hortaea werneckii]|nr:hypothetical protein KC352_g4407 [Hortaea werneckii]KAI7298214.1 hypothetical protein KC340_g14459 [Hortaea werneckii]KAI7375399.1 hypothetical protein KC328_g15471 [Hortaea werneckii]KAI7572466.1 hypothetical protein KC317_g733 [Hortaea werneckii]KAI7627643.1 hypothetical protein KC346_g648 [Hortaea werneckii]